MMAGTNLAPNLRPALFPVHDRHAVDPKGFRDVTLEEPAFDPCLFEVLAQGRRMVGKAI
jgi:hypothetical protein